MKITRASPLFLILVLFVPLASHAGFSSELHEGMELRWQVVTFIQDGQTITENSDEYFIHEGSDIKIKVLKDPSTINFTDSLDISDYFQMTYDDHLKRDLSTLTKLNIGGQLSIPYPTFWDSFIYYIFPIHLKNNTNYFDVPLRDPHLGLIYVDISSSWTSSYDESTDMFSFHAPEYNFSIDFDYSSGIMQSASLDNNGDKVVISKIEPKDNAGFLPIISPVTALFAISSTVLVRKILKSSEKY